MRTCTRLFLLSFLFTVFNIVNAQSQAYVQGKIVDEKGSPLAGASVSEKDRASNGTTTDSAGHFALVLKGKSNQIVISYIGYEDRTLPVSSAPMSISLKAGKSANNEVVVIGYTTQRRRNVTAAVSTIAGRDIKDIPASSFDQTLQGRLAGVSVLSSTGELGARPNIVIRGATNVNYGDANSNGPLYVIDGVIFDVNAVGTSYANTNPLSLINPNDIESIDVLKDASASAIYGARAGNGVIIIKTRRARSGKPQIAFSSYGGITSRPNFREVNTGAAEREIKMQLLATQLPYTNIQQGQIPIQITDSLNPAFNNDVDWQGLTVRNNALVNSEDISIAGITGTTRYRVSFNHYNEQGLIYGYSLDRLAPHLNIEIHPVRGMSVTADVLMSSERRKHGVGGSGGQLFGSFTFPTSFPHLTPEQIAVYTGNKSYYDDNRIFSIVGSVNLLDTLARNLTFNSNFSSTNYTDKYAYFSPVEINGLQNQAYDIGNTSPAWSFENYLSYFKSIGEHHLVVAAGTSSYSNRNFNDYASAKGVSVTGITTIQTIPPGPDLFVSSSNERKTTASYYGRLIYDYDGKYLLTASVRRDASSIYSKTYQWATFPSVSVGWIASDESFFQPVKKAVNFLKLRASYGITGLDPGSWYARYQQLYSDASYLLSTTATLGSSGSTAVLTGTPSTYNGVTVISPYPFYSGFLNGGINSSNSVRWEKYPQLDLGADLELLDSRINITVDWYQKDTKDKYFSGIPAQVTSGYQYYSGNNINLRNSGLEIAFYTRNLGPKSAFQWNTNFNLSFNKNIVTKLPNENRDFLFGPSYFQQTLTYGEALFNYKVFEVNGVFATDNDVPTDPITGRKLTYFGTPLQAGDPKYIDNNGDYNINLDDKVIIGNPTPKMTGGINNTFTYKGFNMNIFCSFLTGRKILNGYLSDYLNGGGNFRNWGSVSGPAAVTDLLSRFWLNPGDQTTFPKLINPSNRDIGSWNIANSYFVEDGSFLKIKQVTFGYTFNNNIAKKLGMKRLNIYGMADNLFIFKKSKVIPDPELVDPTTGSANVVYPSSLKFTFGINLEL